MSRVKSILKAILKAIMDFIQNWLLGLAKRWALWAVAVIFVVFVAVGLLIWFLVGR